MGRARGGGPRVLSEAGGDQEGWRLKGEILGYGVSGGSVEGDQGVQKEIDVIDYCPLPPTRNERREKLLYL